MRVKRPKHTAIKLSYEVVLDNDDDDDDDDNNNNNNNNNNINNLNIKK